MHGWLPSITYRYYYAGGVAARNGLVLTSNLTSRHRLGPRRKSRHSGIRLMSTDFSRVWWINSLAARRLIDMDPNKPNMAKGFFVDRAIDDAVFILEQIDARWPTIMNTFAAKD